jgi:CRP-like cAMP-binding protein
MLRSAQDSPLLASLPRPDRRDLLEHSVEVVMEKDEILCRRGERVKHVYFPLSGTIVLLGSNSGKLELGVGLIGAEGMLGATAMLGVPLWPVKAVVQDTGLARRVDYEAFTELLARSEPLRVALRQILFVDLCQVARTSACARFHLAEARLARWLLMSRDRARTKQVHLTHDYLSNILGVRRAGVTRAASDLRSHELIHYSRGLITIDDDAGLVAAACNCYAADRQLSRMVRS